MSIREHYKKLLSLGIPPEKILAPSKLLKNKKRKTSK